MKRSANYHTRTSDCDEDRGVGEQKRIRESMVVAWWMAAAEVGDQGDIYILLEFWREQQNNPLVVL